LISYPLYLDSLLQSKTINNEEYETLRDLPAKYEECLEEQSESRRFFSDYEQWLKEQSERRAFLPDGIDSQLASMTPAKLKNLCRYGNNSEIGIGYYASPDDAAIFCTSYESGYLVVEVYRRQDNQPSPPKSSSSSGGGIGLGEVLLGIGLYRLFKD